MLVKAIGYARRSKESGQRTVSLDDQRERIEAYCGDAGIVLADVLTDDGVSGGKRERFKRIADSLRKRRARAVVVYHLDRFARDLAGGLDTLDGFARKGVELHVVGRGKVEADTASGFLTTSVELLMAEHYRRAIGEKTRDALARLRAQGRRTSRFPPYGFAFADDGVSLEPVEAEQRAIEEAVRLRPGRSLRALSAELARRGFVARTGKPFVPSVLRDLVRNRTVGNSEIQFLR